jgi:cap2 methyltransferase
MSEGKKHARVEFEENKNQKHQDLKHRVTEDYDIDWKSHTKNKHSAQVWANDTGCEPRCDIPFSRTLQENDPRVQYKRRKGEVKTVVHWGQRKLLMSEIEFLTLYSTRSEVVVYAGAAPGTHIALLSDMFPAIHFYCIDPAPFTIKETDKIRIIQDLFSDEMAEELSNEHPRLLFICDIRSADYDLDKCDVIEAKVQRDMLAQKRWHLLMKPVRSMLKFRLPWVEGMTSYLDGDVYLPVWGPITTTETRLITKENSVAEVEYDNKKYEEQLFFFNTVTRPALYKHNVTEGEGIDHCYDCTAEIHILSSYLETFKAVTKEAIPIQVKILSRKISKQIANNRTLADHNPDPGDRKKRIRHNQWINGMPAYKIFEGYERGSLLDSKELT